MRALALILALVASTASAAIAVDSGFPVSASQSNTTTLTLTTAAFSTAGTGRLLVASLSFGANVSQATVAVSGAGLTWTKRVDYTYGSGIYAGMIGSQIWTAPAPSTLTSQTVTATFPSSAATHGAQLTVWALSGADTSSPAGNSDGFQDNSVGASHAKAVTVTSSQTGSWMFYAYTGCNGSGASTALANTTLTANVSDAGMSCNYVSGRLTAASSSGVAYTYGGSGNDNFTTSAGLEVKEDTGGEPEPPAATPRLRTLMGVGT